KTLGPDANARHGLDAVERKVLAVNPPQLDWNPVRNNDRRLEVYRHPYAVSHLIAGLDGVADRGPCFGGRLLVRMKRQAIAFGKLFRQLDLIFCVDARNKLAVIRG